MECAQISADFPRIINRGSDSRMTEMRLPGVTEERIRISPTRNMEA